MANTESHETQIDAQGETSKYVPKAVRDAARNAEAIHNQVYNTQQAASEQEHQQEYSYEYQYNQQDAPAGFEPLDQNTQQNETQETQSTQEPWEARYKTLKGKYDSEIARNAKELRSLRDQIRQLQDENTRLKSAPQTQTQETAAEVSDKVVQQLADEYGEDFVPAIRGLIQKETSKAVGNLQPRIENVEQQFARETAQQKQNRVFDYLDKNVSGWRETNRSQEFLNWLDLVDPLRGAARRDMLMEAFETGDENRVAQFFETFRTEQSVLHGADTPTPSSQEGQSRPAKQDLSRYVSPSPSRAAAPSENAVTQRGANVQPWTKSQIKAFYDDVRMGKFRGNDTLKRQTEKMIFDAMRNGAVLEG